MDRDRDLELDLCLLDPRAGDFDLDWNRFLLNRLSGDRDFDLDLDLDLFRLDFGAGDFDLRLLGDFDFDLSLRGDFDLDFDHLPCLGRDLDRDLEDEGDFDLLEAFFL